VLLQWQSQADDVLMLDMLRRGEIATLVIDAAFVQYYTAMDCSFVQVIIMSEARLENEGG
jgi:hypothetical protein